VRGRMTFTARRRRARAGFVNVEGFLVARAKSEGTCDRLGYITRNDLAMAGYIGNPLAEWDANRRTDSPVRPAAAFAVRLKCKSNACCSRPE
jgi:hypothetical protein